MGHRSVCTLQADSVPADALRSGPPVKPEVPLPDPGEARMDARSLSAQRQDHIVIDLGPHREFCASRIPDARWCTRAGLPDALRHFPDAVRIVLVSPDGAVAHLAFGDLPAPLQARCRVLQGGMAAWKAASLDTQKGEGVCLHAPNDAFIKPFEAADREKSMREYLEWEVGLLASVMQQPGVDFRLNP